MHHLQREGLAGLVGDGAAHEVQQGLVHAHYADRGEVVVPVLARVVLDGLEEMGRVRVEPGVGLLLDDLTLDLQRYPPDLHDLVELVEELRLRSRLVADARQVHRENADRAGKRIAAEKPPAALAELGGVNPKPAAHRHGVLRREVGVDVIREVRDAVLGGDLHEGVEGRAVPVEVPRDVDRRDGEREDPALGVALHHRVAERAVEDVHLLLVVAVPGALEDLAAEYHGLPGKRTRHRKVEREVGKRALEAHPRRHVQVEDELLEGLLHLVVREVVLANERRAVGVETAPRLRPCRLALGGERGVDDLAQEAAKVPGGLGLDLARHAAEAPDEKLPQVPACAVRAEEAQIVDVGVAGFVALTHLGGVYLVQPVMPGEELADVVVQAVDGPLLVGVLLGLPVAVLEVAAEHFYGRADKRVEAAGAGAFLAVEDERLCRAGVPVLDQDLLDEVLDLLDLGYLAEVLSIGKLDELPAEPLGPGVVLPAAGDGGLVDRAGDLLGLEWHNPPIALSNPFEHRCDSLRPVPSRPDELERLAWTASPATAWQAGKLSASGQ